MKMPRNSIGISRPTWWRLHFTHQVLIMPMSLLRISRREAHVLSRPARLCLFTAFTQALGQLIAARQVCCHAIIAQWIGGYPV